jgi:hypothetical protein
VLGPNFFFLSARALCQVVFGLHLFLFGPGALSQIVLLHDDALIIVIFMCRALREQARDLGVTDLALQPQYRVHRLVWTFR